jgi:hypothetical protein
LRILFTAAFTCMLLGHAPALAEPGGTSSVTNASVSRGNLEYELRTAAFDGGEADGAWRHRAHVGYSFNDTLRSTLILRADQPDGEGAELRSIGLENVVDFDATAEWPFRLGGLFEYKAGLNGADDEIVLKLLAARVRGDTEARINLTADRPIGADSEEWTHAYAASYMWEASDAIEIGAESFGEFDTNAHYLGPRVEMKAGDVGFGFAALAGFADAAADVQFRISLELNP